MISRFRQSTLGLLALGSLIVVGGCGSGGRSLPGTGGSAGTGTQSTGGTTGGGGSAAAGSSGAVGGGGATGSGGTLDAGVDVAMDTVDAADPDTTADRVDAADAAVCPRAVLPGLNQCAQCPGMPCSEGATCSSLFHSGGPSEASCVCLNGRMACCAYFNLGLGGSGSCDYGGSPGPDCPREQPAHGEACGALPRICSYPSCSFTGATSAYCPGNGGSWSLSPSAYPTVGSPCTIAAGLSCDSGTPQCSCMATDGGAFWQCSKGASCYPERQPGDDCSGFNGAYCNYSAQRDGSSYRCLCERAPDAGADADAFTWACYTP